MRARKNAAMLTSVALASTLALLAGDDPVQAWSDDVLQLVAEIERMHPDPYAACPRAEFEAAVDAFLGGIEGRDEEANVVELMRLVARLAREREGHALVWSTEFD